MQEGPTASPVVFPTGGTPTTVPTARANEAYQGGGQGDQRSGEGYPRSEGPVTGLKPPSTPCSSATSRTWTFELHATADNSELQWGLMSVLLQKPDHGAQRDWTTQCWRGTVRVPLARCNWLVGMMTSGFGVISSQLQVESTCPLLL